jgi:hypothetical protein
MNIPACLVFAPSRAVTQYHPDENDAGIGIEMFLPAETIFDRSIILPDASATDISPAPASGRTRLIARFRYVALKS